MTNLPEVTQKESSIINAIATNEFSNEPGDAVWANCIDETSLVSRAAMGGVIGSLNTKGLVKSQGAGNDATVKLTEEGIRYWEATTKK